jgi:uncharacterized membrane protein (UPF0127 family)
VSKLAYLGIVVAGMSAWTGCSKSGSKTPATGFTLYEPKQAQPRLQTLRLWLGPQEITAELALTPIQVQTGMMFRTNLVENEGMLFILSGPQRASFWMKNCPKPLSCAYIDPQGIIQEIHDMEPFNTNAIVADSENVVFVLETARGWFERSSVRTGMVVRTERGSLADTFLRRR